ncbi:MAG: riboflavin synthase [Bdellovibrionales bacterium]
MFSGIVENQAVVLDRIERAGVLAVTLERPENFTDLKIGDSVAVNGVCLTIESLTAQTMSFALGAETLQVTGWTAANLDKQKMNIERSLRFGDRVHGHLVSGHVDAMGKILATEKVGENLKLKILFPEKLKTMIWHKGSVAVNGVSLTINQVERGQLSVGLIPETLKRTNLGELQTGDSVTLEADMMARGLTRWLDEKGFELAPKFKVNRDASAEWSQTEVLS